MAKLSKQTYMYVKNQIIISPLILCISVIFLQLAMVQYTIFKTVLLYLLKVDIYVFMEVCFYEHQQETKVPFLAVFSIFSGKSSEINLKR